MADYGAEFLTQAETIEGTWAYADHEFALLVEDISIGELELLQEYTQVAGAAINATGDDVDEEALEEANEQAKNLDSLPWEDDVEADSFLEATIEAKLIKPDVDLSDARAHKLTAVFEGMMQAWQEGNR